MSGHPGTDLMRIVIMFVCALSAIVGSFQWRRFRHFLPENQLAWMALVVLNVALGYGTWEIYRQGLPGGFRNVLQLLGALWLLAAVCYHPTRRIRARLRERKS